MFKDLYVKILEMKYLVNLLPHVLDHLAKFSTSVSSEIYLIFFEIQISLNSIIQ